MFENELKDVWITGNDLYELCKPRIDKKGRFIK